MTPLEQSKTTLCPLCARKDGVRRERRSLPRPQPSAVGTLSIFSSLRASASTSNRLYRCCGAAWLPLWRKELRNRDNRDNRDFSDFSTPAPSRPWRTRRAAAHWASRACHGGGGGGWGPRRSRSGAEKKRDSVPKNVAISAHSGPSTESVDCPSSPRPTPRLAARLLAVMASQPPFLPSPLPVRPLHRRGAPEFTRRAASLIRDSGF